MTRKDSSLHMRAGTFKVERQMGFKDVCGYATRFTTITQRHEGKKLAGCGIVFSWMEE
jgi:hypothetical protein